MLFPTVVMRNVVQREHEERDQFPIKYRSAAPHFLAREASWIEPGFGRRVRGAGIGTAKQAWIEKSRW
jgi:hypothetical protein